MKPETPGLRINGVDPRPTDEEALVAPTMNFSPDQERDEDGKFASGGGSGGGSDKGEKDEGTSTKRTGEDKAVFLEKRAEFVKQVKETVSSRGKALSKKEVSSLFSYATDTHKFTTDEAVSMVAEATGADRAAIRAIGTGYGGFVGAKGYKGGLYKGKK